MAAWIAAGCGGAAPGAPTVTPRPSASSAIAPAATAAGDVEPAAAAIVYRGDSTGRRVALTFDAGADAGFAAEVLDILRAKNVPAAFGITGRWAEQNPDLVRRIAADGHVIINHTYDHASFTGYSTGKGPLSSAERAEELRRADQIIADLAGGSTRPYFRPPFGDVDDSVAHDAAAAGYGVIVMWTVDTLGWNGASADAIVERGLRLAEPGAIYVMHVGADSEDAAALPRLIDGLRAAGYALVSLPALLGR